MVRRHILRLLVFTSLPVAAACGRAALQAPIAPVAPPIAEAPAPPPTVDPLPPPATEDPVLVLLAEADQHFRNGQSELQAGHAQSAREEFDRALNVLIESPYGGRTEPRIREEFDRLVDRISTYEVRSLAQGDGFTEQQYEPASIDELLALSATMVPPLPSVSLTESLKIDIQTGQHDIPIPLNDRVLAFIGLFQGRMHSFLEEGLKRGSKYLPMIQDVFRAEGLPLDLAYVPLVESAFKPNALSRARAKGVWQFMAGTGAENGLKQDWYIDERSDPEKATVAAAKYLTTLSKMFDGDWHLALASYNGGPGRLQRAIRTGGANDFWDLAAKPRALPRETRDYVPMILAAIVIARNPAQYGFSFTPEPKHEYDKVEISKPVDLRRIAEWSDSTINGIQALNPELRRLTTPIRSTSYTLKVPPGTGTIVQAKLDSSANDALASLRWYTAKRGDTIASIARALRVGRSDLAAANYLKVTARVKPGTKLMVPHESTVLMAARADRPAPAQESRALVADKVVPAVAATTPNLVKVSYKVKRGDTLGSIAQVFRTSVSSIRRWNNIRGSRITAGDQLTIYTNRARVGN